MNLLKRIVAASGMTVVAAVAAPSLENIAEGDFSIAQAAADCRIKATVGGRGSSKTERLQAKGAAKTCGIRTAIHGFKFQSDAVATMKCRGSKCDTREATITYNYGKNVVTVTTQGVSATFDAARYTANIRQRQARGCEKFNEDVYAGLTFEGSKPAAPAGCR